MTSPRAAHSPNLRSLGVLALVPLVMAVLTAWPRARAGADGALETLAARPWLADERALTQCVRAGTFPSWNPYSGAPLAAAARTGAWYPPRALVYVAGPERAAPLLAFSASFAAGLGVALFLARCGLRAHAALFAALACQLGVAFVAHGRSPELFDPLVWAPWAWWALAGLARRAPASGPVLALALGLALTAGNSPAAGAVCASTLLGGVLALFTARTLRTFAERARFSARWAAWSACGLALGAVQWLPAWCATGGALPPAFELARLTERPSESPAKVLDDATLAAVRRAAGDGRAVELERTDASGAPARALAPPELLAARGVFALVPGPSLPARDRARLLARIDPASGGVRGLSQAALVNHRVFDLLRVTCVLTREPVENSRLTLVHAGGDTFVYARSRALPLARAVPAELVRVAGEVAVFGLLAAGGFDPRRGAIANSEELFPRAESRAPFTPGEIVVARPAWDRLDAEVRGGAGGWLVFHEPFAPGWKAIVNGADAEVVRVDAVCRAVSIPPGDVRVRTKYEPAEFRVAAWLTFAALALCVFAAARELTQQHLTQQHLTQNRRARTA